MMKVVFLDFDGVLNSSRWFAQGTAFTHPEDQLDPEAVKLLNELDADVVVSSAWRYGYKRIQLSEFLRNRGFTGRVIDTTPRLPGKERFEEINAWLKGKDVTSFVVLDDIAEAISPWWAERGILIQDGLTPDHVIQAKRILSS
jgi:hypothetical protein